MEQYVTLFSRVYQDLKGRIVTGQFPSGGDFPSIQRLRQEYQIGFRTAKEVTVRLREEGYIASRNRKPPQVCWEGGMPAALAVLSHRGQLAELYDAFAIVMPLLSSFASQTCDMRLLPSYEQTKRAMHRGMKPREWGLLSRLCRELFQACGNPLFSEVYARFNRYSHLPFFFTCDDSPLRAQMDWHGDFFAALENRNIQEKYNWLSASYLRTADAVRMSLNLLEAEYRGVVLPPAEPFQWGGLYGYDPIYIQIAQDLIAKINTGVYPLEQYLPHEAELAKAYGVSLTTVRKELVELRRLGYCRTLNVKGSIAQRCSIETVCRAVRNPTRKRDAMRYLYGLQFMALLAGPAARLAAPRFTAEEKAALAAQFKRPDAIPLILLVECIGRHLDPEPLRAIFLETEHLVRWGYCTLLHESRSERVRRVNHKSRAAFDALLAEDMETFSLEMADYYRSSFQMVRTQYIQYYRLSEAEAVMAPPLGLL